MDFFNTYATDESKELNGQWQELNGAEFLIARAGNKKYMKKLGALLEENEQLLKVKGDESDAKGDEIVVEVLAETIVLGWRSKDRATITFKGEELAYSVENAKRLLALKDLRRALVKYSDDMSYFKVVEEEAQVKN